MLEDMLDIDVDYVELSFFWDFILYWTFISFYSFRFEIFNLLVPDSPFSIWKPMNAMNVYLDGLLEGPSGLTNVVSHLGPILDRDKRGGMYQSGEGVSERGIQMYQRERSDVSEMGFSKKFKILGNFRDYGKITYVFR